jgi:CspA family cold shock protein
MATGVVKWFNAQKGYGFIEPSDRSKDIFVHVTALEEAGIDTLREGDKVSYEIENGRNGKVHAGKLKRI